MLKRIIIGLAAAGLLTLAPVSPAHAGDGCVTVREARDTLGTDTRQDRRAVERGFGDTGWTEDRIGNSLWRSYTPCEYPGRNDTFVSLIYAKNAAGNWKAIYWAWSLYYPTGFRAVTGKWNGVAR